MRMLWLLIAVFLGGCGGSSDPVAVAPVTEAAVAPPGPIVFMGDSITFQWQLPTGYVNAGISGQTSEQMLARFQSDALSLNPSIVTILAGTNDLRNSATPSVSAIETMAQDAGAAGACVILATIPPDANLLTTSAVKTQAQLDQVVSTFNAQIAQFAALNGYMLADYHAVLVNPDGTENTALFNTDLYHPNAAGDAAMWSVIAPLIAQCQ